MEEDRRSAIKKAILDYILLDPAEQERLGVPIPPKVSSVVPVYRFLQLMQMYCSNAVIHNMYTKIIHLLHFYCGILKILEGQFSWIDSVFLKYKKFFIIC